MFRIKYTLAVLSLVVVAPYAGAQHGSTVPAVLEQESRPVSTNGKLNVSSKSLHDFVKTNAATIKDSMEQGFFLANRYSATVALIDGHDLITPKAMECARTKLGVTLTTFTLEQLNDLLRLTRSIPASDCSAVLQASLNEAMAWILAREAKTLVTMSSVAAAPPASTTSTICGGGCGGGCGDGCGGCGGCGGFDGGFEGGAFFGAPFFPGVNPAGRGYLGFGRFPLQPFFTPLRPWGGITPVRQFLFGRGRERRLNRRACLFGGFC